MFLKISPWLQQISNVQFPILFLTGLMIISSLFLSLLAIGLSLILKQQLHGIGPVVEGETYNLGDQIGRTVFTTGTGHFSLF